MMRMSWRTVLLLLMLLATAAAVQAGPRIEATQVRHDFGKVNAGERAEHVFEIRNNGDETLVIQKVQSS